MSDQIEFERIDTMEIALGLLREERDRLRAENAALRKTAAERDSWPHCEDCNFPLLPNGMVCLLCNAVEALHAARKTAAEWQAACEAKDMALKLSIGSLLMVPASITGSVCKKASNALAIHPPDALAAYVAPLVEACRLFEDGYAGEPCDPAAYDKRCRGIAGIRKALAAFEKQKR